MSLDMDFGGIGNADDLQSGGDRAVPGNGMVLITGFTEYGAVNGRAHLLEFELVAWTDMDSMGVGHKENIFHEDTYKDGAPFKKMAALGVATGLCAAQDIVAWQKAEQMPQIDFSQVVGRPMMVQLTESEKNGKTYINVGEYGKAYYHLLDPRVIDWPKNQQVYNDRVASVGQFLTVGDKKPAAAAAATADPFANA
ncbi:MAG: hypothetical protein GY826_16565 [Fuerstiella sp.]|nr:hypothetical protein [Fuerstiella sp.]